MKDTIAVSTLAIAVTILIVLSFAFLIPMDRTFWLGESIVCRGYKPFGSFHTEKTCYKLERIK